MYPVGLIFTPGIIDFYLKLQAVSRGYKRLQDDTRRPGFIYPVQTVRWNKIPAVMTEIHHVTLKYLIIPDNT